MKPKSAQKADQEQENLIPDAGLMAALNTQFGHDKDVTITKANKTELANAQNEQSEYGNNIQKLSITDFSPCKLYKFGLWKSYKTNSSRCSSI